MLPSQGIGRRIGFLITDSGAGPIALCRRRGLARILERERHGERVSCGVAAGRSPAATPQETSFFPVLSFPRGAPERSPFKGQAKG